MPENGKSYQKCNFARRFWATGGSGYKLPTYGVTGIKYYELQLQSVKKAHLLPFANIANHVAKRITEIWGSFSLPTIQIKLPALS